VKPITEVTAILKIGVMSGTVALNEAAYTGPAQVEEMVLTTASSYYPK
jgi:hypothetical protein